MNSLKEAKDTGEIQWVIDLGRYKSLTEEASEGGIYDVEERFLHTIDRALTLLLLDRENFGSMIQSGWRVGGLVALLVALLVMSPPGRRKSSHALGLEA